MPYCPIHGFQPGKFCSECSVPLSETPSAPGDSARVRSPESHSHASANPTFVFSSGQVETRPALVKCPRCGQHKAETEIFDCTGDCGRQNLCLQHFDEEYLVCKWCANDLRGIARVEAGRQAQLQADLATWRQRAELAEARVDELIRQGEQTQRPLEQARAEFCQAQERVRSFEQELAAQRQRADQAEGQLAAIELARKEAEEALKSKPIWQQIGIDLVRIPAGEFLMGSDPGRDKNAEVDEQPQKAINLAEFYIARTPITNGQFEIFVRAASYKTQPEKFNFDYTWRTPEGQGSGIQDKAQHPVVCVTWHDAQAFCQWAGVRLPTETEWEKAARGADGRLYPWGNGASTPRRCNFAESYIFGSMPVGQYLYLAGASPYGLLDMAGNVWEWCSSLYKDYPYDDKDGQEDSRADGLRVLRGGSWFRAKTHMRCACRLSLAPDYVLSEVGFRVARSSLL